MENIEKATASLNHFFENVDRSVIKEMIDKYNNVKDNNLSYSKYLLMMDEELNFKKEFFSTNVFFEEQASGLKSFASLLATDVTAEKVSAVVNEGNTQYAMAA